MKLETHEGPYADPAEAGDIARVVAGLTQVGKAYVVLSDGDYLEEMYVQAAGTVGEHFIIEWRDGRAGDHYRGDRRVSTDELVAVLAGYLRRDPDWSAALTWHRVRFDLEPARA